MKPANEYSTSPSYFWDCLTFSDNCPFFTKSDPKLLYFGIALGGLYTAFFLMIVADLKFYWSLEQLQQQIHYYINFIRKKVRCVQMNQKRLVSMKERTDKQLKRSEDCRRIVTVLRVALANNPDKVRLLTNEADNTETEESPQRCNDWPDSKSTVDFSI